MKVYIGKYPKNIHFDIYGTYIDKKYGSNVPTSTTTSDRFFDRLDTFVNNYISSPLNAIFASQKVKVRIDRQDTWSMDHTLAHIILPMLKQLKETTHGAPYVENVDVPEELQMTVHEKLAWKVDGETNDKWHDRWHWVLGEMIHAFEQKVKDDWMDEFSTPNSSAEWGIDVDHEGIKKEQARISNGFRLFGKYYEGLWD